MTLVRTYTGGTTDYTSAAKKINVSYQLANVDSVYVSATFDAAQLTDAQTDELCYALHNAISTSGILWITNIDVNLQETGSRQFRVAVADPPPTTP